MHPQKAKLLAQLHESARTRDEVLAEAIAAVRAPHLYGWSDSLVIATVMLPLTGLGAVFNDLSIVLVSRTPDATWEKAFPPPPEL